jgi:glycosyltransferase involved in cell wall biosynthesis
MLFKNLSGRDKLGVGVVRLAIWNTNYFRGFGGAEKAVTDLVNRFNELGIETFLIANKFAKNQASNQFFEPLHPSVKTYQNSFTNPWDFTHKPARFIAKLLQYLKATINFTFFLHRNKVQIIHLHYVSWDILFLALCKRLFGYRLVITFQGGEDSMAKQVRLSKLKIRIALKSADRVTSVSKELCERAKTRYSVSNVIYIPNGVDAKRIQQLATPSAAIEPDHLLFCGRFSAEKRVDFLIEAFHDCVQKGCRRNLYLVGDGGEIDRITSLISSYGMKNRIIILGALPHRQTLGVISQSRCLLLTSLFEGMPLVVLEAMALSKPVIVSDVGGLKDMVIHGESGYLYPVDRRDILCDWILRVSEDKAKAAELGAKGFDILSAKYDLDRIVENYLALYRSL